MRKVFLYTFTTYVANLENIKICDIKKGQVKNDMQGMHKSLDALSIKDYRAL